MDQNADDASLSRRDFFRAGAAGVALTAGVAAGSGTAAAAYDGWLDGVNNYDGTHDRRGQDEVRVTVGAGDNGLLFGPAAVLIDPGTTVVWEWSGAGGGHNVVEADEELFASETISDAGHTFEHTFADAEDGDTFEYSCEPHESVGMKGAIAVGDVDDDIVTDDGGGGGNGGDGGGGDGESGEGGDGGGGDGSGDGEGGDGGGGDGGDGSDGGRDLSVDDFAALAMGFGFAGALLVPLFYAAHRKSDRNRRSAQ